ncbi:TPA: glycosyl transferase family 2 [Candidatus Uhrbacteria bacterium]|nr:glycosyl transferase family 2 [Candidatus Uhrbacteria bacterium]HCB18913.1 glycosyl transferase family 2 [Candidatus Uhrbacteria bacterium]
MTLVGGDNPPSFAMVNVAAIVPAYNEAQTIKEVVRVLRVSSLLSEVIVVSDGSTDMTASYARESGATVYELPHNRGKGGAMRYGVTKTKAEIIIFFDADLIGLTVEHIEQLVRPVLEGSLAMCVGLRDRGVWFRILGPRLPLISGERAMKREVIEQIPERFLRRFMVEASINYFCRTRAYAYGTVFLSSLTIRRKCQKVGILHGVKGYLLMIGQIIFAMVTVRLARIFHQF